MAQQMYAQATGLGYALDIVGKRWALLIVGDLLDGPKRFTDLRNALVGIPSNILSARLKELEIAGVAERKALPHPGGGVVYELTELGAELEDVVIRLGKWGAQLVERTQTP
jgi:DNA-binding HxlR family transcriptional regulator